MRKYDLIGLFLAGSALTLATMAGCGSGDDVSDGTGSEVAVAAMGGSSSASEGSIALNSSRANPPTVYARLKSSLALIPSAWAVPQCDWAGAISSCASNSETLTFSSCSAPSDPAIRIEGSETLAWSGAGCCTASPLNASSITPCSFTRRTVTSSGALQPLVRSVGANAISLDTETPSGYDQSKSGGFTVTCQGAGGTNTCEAQREVTIAGAHYTGKSGRDDWDHTVSTDAPIVEQGSGGSRKILSGTIRVQHNLLKITSITTVTSTLTHTAGCCFPTGGSITTTYAGGKLDGKSESLSFGPGCGESTLEDTRQQKTGLTLRHCL